MLPGALDAVYPRLIGGLCLGIGAVFLGVTARRALENRCDAAWLAAAVGAMLGAASLLSYHWV